EDERRRLCLRRRARTLSAGYGNVDDEDADEQGEAPQSTRPAHDATSPLPPTTPDDDHREAEPAHDAGNGSDRPHHRCRIVRPRCDGQDEEVEDDSNTAGN